MNIHEKIEDACLAVIAMAVAALSLSLVVFVVLLIFQVAGSK